MKIMISTLIALSSAVALADVQCQDQATTAAIAKGNSSGYQDCGHPSDYSVDRKAQLVSLELKCTAQDGTDKIQVTVSFAGDFNSCQVYEAYAPQELTSGEGD